ncbi:MAG: hypothetical protein DHS20C14_05590 [Phycisphaeraceae bacterium]|nr:MAG: hypothetical protein DHS20C14_05590 [Phycisphaeraceae bacterium]
MGGQDTPDAAGRRPPARTIPPMARPTPWEDEYTLLCERCGYVVEGLDPASNCPECGKPIAESLPERRVGTPWQQGAHPVSLCMSWAGAILEPHTTLDRLRFDPLPFLRSSRVMILATALLTGLVITIVAAQALIVDWERQPLISEKSDLDPIVPIFAFIGGVMYGSFAALLIACLTAIETAGLMFIGSRRGCRIDFRASAIICAHGSIGWLLGIAGYAIVWFLYNGWSRPAGLAFNATAEWSYPWELDALWILLLPLAGFLFFEIFAWLGLRRCKFANRALPVAHARGSSPRASETRGKEPGA